MSTQWTPPEDDDNHDAVVLPPAPPPPPPYEPYAPPARGGYAPNREPYPETNHYAGQVPAYAPHPIGNGMAVAGLVCGIVGACLFWVPVLNFILATLAIVFGGIGWYKSRSLVGAGRGKSITAVVLGVVTMVGWFVFWAAVLGSVGSSTAAALAAVPDQVQTQTQDAITNTSATLAPVHHNATKRDFKVTLKVTDEQCFGYGAGCQIEYNAYLKYVGPKIRKPAAHDTYHVTYRVTGGNAGPVVASFLTDGAKADYQSGFVTTDNRSQKVRATVTSVEKYS